jgi:arylamine N-acetyltransferase
MMVLDGDARKLVCLLCQVVRCTVVRMYRADAEKLAARLQAEHPDGATHRFFARLNSDESWSVAKVGLPAHLRKAPLRISAEHKPPQPFAEDVRSGHEMRVPGLPGGLG